MCASVFSGISMSSVRLCSRSFRLVFDFTGLAKLIVIGRDRNNFSSHKFKFKSVARECVYVGDDRRICKFSIQNVPLNQVRIVGQAYYLWLSMLFPLTTVRFFKQECGNSDREPHCWLIWTCAESI
jgi:hypothetical protein